MAKGISAREAAMRWGLSERSITGMCRNGKIPGAIKEKGVWYIPENAERPEDGRIRHGEYKKEEREEPLPLPIGISDFRTASTEYYYVDKTMLIKDFLDERPMVSLFTRPRRFGKTLNMDMLRTFFEKTDEDTSIYFRNKEIWKYGTKYQSYQGKYPVIFVSFKDVKYETWEETVQKLAEIIGNEFARHEELEESVFCNDVDKAAFRRMKERAATDTELSGAFQVLTRMLHEHHKVAPIIIIDEYDTPIQQGHMSGFYDEVILFMRNLFSGGLKDNSHLSFGFLTGILCVAKESIFSGLNNLTINSILDHKYSEYFGFTPSEVQAMAQYYHASDKCDEVCEWYDGYRFGSSEIFNPWSVIYYFRNGCRAGAYWQFTGSNEIIGEVLAEAGEDIYDQLCSLLKGGTFFTYVDTGVIYPEVRKNPSSVYSFLLVAGYLRVLRAEAGFMDGFMCEVKLPNKEIASVYKKEILGRMGSLIPNFAAVSIQEALYLGDMESLQKQIRQYLLQTVSAFDAVGESFYHGMLLGLCAMMEDHYYIASNRESGDGRFDIQLSPKTNRLPGILMELKWKKDATGLKSLAQDAVRQINEKQYDTLLLEQGVKKILRYGVAFSGKNVEVCLET